MNDELRTSPHYALDTLLYDLTEDVVLTDSQINIAYECIKEYIDGKGYNDLVETVGLVCKAWLSYNQILDLMLRTPEWQERVDNSREKVIKLLDKLVRVHKAGIQLPKYYSTAPEPPDEKEQSNG